jgi:hypothetical protein
MAIPVYITSPVSEEEHEMGTKRLGLAVIGVLLGISLVTSGCQGAARAAEEPATVVEAFYKWLIGYPGNAAADRAYRSSEYVTAEFVARIDTTLESMGPGGADPFLCAQDIPQSFSIGDVTVAGKSASVVLREAWNPGTSYEITRDLTVTLRLVDGHWRIDRIACPGPAAAQAQPADPSPTAPPEQPPVQEQPVTESPADDPAAQDDPPTERVSVWPIDGWQTFQDERYGFEFQYPPDWTVVELPLAQPELSAPIVRIVQLLPQEWAEQLNPGGPPDPEAPTIVAPLSVEISVGWEEEFRRAYVGPASSEPLAINGYPVVLERDVAGDFAMIRYIFQPPADARVRVAVVDQISGFSTRAAENADILPITEQILSTWHWVK